MKKYCFGVDVGGTTIKIGFLYTDGTMLDKWEIKTNTENFGETILSDICKWAASLNWHLRTMISWRSRSCGRTL